MITLFSLISSDLHFHPIASHNFKRVKITNIGIIWDQIFAYQDVQTLISFPMGYNMLIEHI